MLRDLRYALRTLGSAPGFTVVAVLSIALGIGANSAVFSAADAMLLRPLEVPRSSEVISINGATQDTRLANLSYAEYRDLSEQSRTVGNLVAFAYAHAGMAEHAGALPQLHEAIAVSANFFNALEITPSLGRAFSPSDEREPVAILSYTFWQQHFSADPNILGRRILFNDFEMTIVGVAPETFSGTDSILHPDLYIPALMLPHVVTWANAIEQREARYFAVKGRLARGATLAQAADEMDAIARRMREAWPSENRNRSLVVRTELGIRFAQAPD